MALNAYIYTVLILYFTSTSDSLVIILMISVEHDLLAGVSFLVNDHALAWKHGCTYNRMVKWRSDISFFGDL